jgi:hypothetical protein
MAAGGQVQGGTAVRGGVHLIAAGAQVDAQRADDLRLVVHDQYASHGPSFVGGVT